MMIVLRLIHILAGVFWAGAAFFAASFLLPSVRDAGPAGAPVMRQLMIVRKFPIAALVTGLLSVASGIWMYWRDNSMSNGSFAKSTAGMTYGVGGVFAILTLVVGATIMGPSSDKLGKLGAEVAAKGGPPTNEQAATMQALQARLRLGARLASSFLGITVITMAIGRYL